MGKRAELIEGLQILERYEPGKYADAQHDVVYGAHSGIELIDADAKRLDELGWFIDDEVDSWAFFT